jgi:hypothetical protein
MQQGPVFDVVTDDDGEFAAEGIAGVQALTVVAVSNPFYVADDPDPNGFKHLSDEAGTVTAEAIQGFGPTTMWQVRFVSKDGASEVQAEGHLANHPDGRPGNGTLTVRTATGVWAGTGRIAVRASNPRRWTAVA